jgi:hypothetical protein
MGGAWQCAVDSSSTDILINSEAQSLAFSIGKRQERVTSDDAEHHSGLSAPRAPGRLK